MSEVPSVPDTAPSSFLARLIARAQAADGQPPFSDQSLVDLRTGARELLVVDGGAAVVSTPSTSEVSAGGAGSPVTEAEFVVDPDARGQRIGTALLVRLLARSHGELLVWAHGDHPSARALARSHGLAAVRALLRLELLLDAQDHKHEHEHEHEKEQEPRETVGGGTSRMRAFRAGTDEEEWLALNARAFVSHPEQGQVSRADLEELMAERWFSADDFLLLHEGGKLVGYCWLKIDGVEGEIYVLGVDPERQGEGFGRRLTLAGLDRLRQRGIRSVQLYVEGGNAAAVSLYRSLGFVDRSVDIQYRATRS